MPVRGSEARNDSARGNTIRPFDELLLARIACEGGATRAEIVRDLGAAVSHRLSPAEWRKAVEQGCADLQAVDLVTDVRGRLCATPAARMPVSRFLGQSFDGLVDWACVRDLHLVAKALGIETGSASRLKALANPDVLRTRILQKAFALNGHKNIPVAKLRAQLAVVALERAFGHTIKAGFGKGSSLSSRAGRLLAGQLSKSPRDFATDAKLIAQLAADQVGAVQTDADAVRLAILRKLTTHLLESSKPAVAIPASLPLPVAANDAGPPAASGPAPRPGLGDFAQSVKKAAAPRAQGWPGNKKAFISQVWDAIRIERESWELSEIEFKCMLAEAHRHGALVLAGADLKDKKNLAEIERSATLYKNTVWHFVRVEE